MNSNVENHKYSNIDYGTSRLNQIVFTLCLLAPIFSHTLRKLLPGNSSSIELTSIPIVFFIGIWALFRFRLINTWLWFPMATWISLLVIYIIPSVGEEYRVGIVSIGTKIVPILFIHIASSLIRSPRDLKFTTYTLMALLFVFTPVSLYVSLFGDSLLPIILKPSDEKMAFLKGFYMTSSSLFSTPTQLSYFAYVSLILTSLLFIGYRGKVKILLLLAMVSSITIVLLNGRRSVMLLSFIAVLFATIVIKKKAILFVIFLLTVPMIYRFVSSSEMSSLTAPERLEYLLLADPGDDDIVDSGKKRIQQYVVQNAVTALEQYPLGSYLGKFGPEGRAYSVNYNAMQDQAFWSETGSVNIACEMGYLGLITYVTIMIIILATIYRRARYSIYKNEVYMLLLFLLSMTFVYFFKAGPILSGYQVQAYFYWAAFGLCASFTRNEYLRNPAK